VQLTVVATGEEALALLRGQSAGRAALPDLILLDLNLPGLSGHETLAEIKADERLRYIPVIVLSSSRAMADVNRSYDLHANCFIHKPAQWSEYTRVIRAIEMFWLTVVQLPRG
jgi:CheY-like chemotaxis protein